ncbi:aldose epimerase family protein [Tessaracoccus sp. Z1128]
MTIHELHGAWGRGRVSELGGCVLSWAPEGRGEMLWMAREAQLRPGEMWHGGIPVCAPWFGVGTGEFAVPFPHGLVSRVTWETELVEQSDEGAKVVLVLGSPGVAHLPGAELYPPDLDYRLDVRTGRRRLSVELTVTSPTRDVVADVALHPYFAVDAGRAVVAGLEGVSFRDFAVDAAADVEDAPVPVGRHVDRVYRGAPATILRDGSCDLRLSADGAANVVVWNPGPGGAQVAGGGWSGFACVEYGCVQGDAVSIPAGGSHTIALRVEV